MDYIKHFFLSRFKIVSLVTVSILFSGVLLMIRMKLTHSFHYIFLIWNLFLAVIPFAITSYLVCTPKFNNIALIFWLGVWLLFLPNAPYIVTDLMHLRLSYGSYVWLDTLVMSSFAINGLLLFYLSILDIKNVLKQYLKKPIINFGMTLTIFLSSFGVYLGRFLRYNSWELLSNPKYLFIDILNITVKPLVNKEAWLFTLLFGTFLSIGFWIFKQLFSNYDSINRRNY